MPTKIRLSAIPGSNTSNIHAQGVLIARADFNHRENVVETREWKGSICAQALRKLAQETASLAVAERPGRYPDLIVIHARAEGRAPAGFNDLRHEMIFSRAEIDALAKPASTTPAAVAAAVALALLMSAGAAMAQNQQSPRNCQGNGGSTYCNQPVNQNIQQTWANGGAGGNASANGSGSASATISRSASACTPAPAEVASSRMPATLAPFRSTSFGHFSEKACGTPVRATKASRKAKAAAKLRKAT